AFRSSSTGDGLSKKRLRYFPIMPGPPILISPANPPTGRTAPSKSTPSRYQNWPSSLTEPDLSALPCGAARDVRFGPKADIGFLFDHLVGLREKRWGDGYAESLGCPEVDHQLEFGRCLHRQVAGLFALKDSVNVPCRESIQLNTIRPIGEQATGGGKEPLVV